MHELSAEEGKSSCRVRGGGEEVKRREERRVRKRSEENAAEKGRRGEVQGQWGKEEWEGSRR